MTEKVRLRFQRRAAEHVILHSRGLQGLTDLATVSHDPVAKVSEPVEKALVRNVAGGPSVTGLRDHWIPCQQIDVYGEIGSAIAGLTPKRGNST
jgi:hypothetical protein